MSAPATEPVRRNLYPAAVVAALTAFLGPLAAAPDVTLQLILGALVAAVAAFGSVVFGLERARGFAWAPASVDRTVRAVTIQARAPAGEPSASPTVEHVCPEHGTTHWVHPDFAHCPACAGEVPDPDDPLLRERPS
jgi:hypothetical protein